jgi:hypothetical protein
MDPQGLLGQINQSMSQGIPELGQVSSTSPNFDQQLQPNAPSPMPDKSPASMISPLHSALQRRGMPIPPQLAQQNQGVGQVTVPNGTPGVQDTNKQQPGVQIPASEAELIIKALTSRLGMLGKHESAVRDHLFPQNIGIGTNQPSF